MSKIRGMHIKEIQDIKSMYIKNLNIKLSPCLVYFECSYIIMKTVWGVKICAKFVLASLQIKSCFNLINRDILN